jgi:hypothetical protein
MVLTSISKLSTSALVVSTHKLPVTLVSRLCTGPDQLVTEQRVFYVYVSVRHKLVD